MNVMSRPVNSLMPYERNNKKHGQQQIDNVAESIRQYGFVQPIVIDKNNVVVIGHCRLLAAKQLKMAEVPCVCVDDLTDEQVRKLRIIDNKTNESEWDFDNLKLEFEELDFSDFDIDFGMEKAKKDNPYTSKIKIPQYDIQGEQPAIQELIDENKVVDLEAEIEASGVTQEEKTFLMKAAQRHRVFDYRNIAEYYAAATREMQTLMEKSALVIIDYDDAIANGYVRLSERLKRLSGNDA